MKQPLVSVIVPTKNSAQFLDACLKSIKDQTYKNIELIVVDNHSTDETPTIAKKYTDHVYTHGPERSAQRNFGAERSKGEYILIIDADMQLTPAVIESCLGRIRSAGNIKAITIPEESFGRGIWSQCKKLEKSFYSGVSWIEAPRFFNKQSYLGVGGYDLSMISGEDWDLSRRIRAVGSIESISEYILHNEGNLKLLHTLKKKYYYAQNAKVYLSRNPHPTMLSAQNGPLQRYKLYFSKPTKLLHNPFLGLAMLIMKTFEFAAGGAGFLEASIRPKPKEIQHR